MIFRAFIVAVAVLSATSAAAAEASVPISVDAGGMVTVGVVINGSAPLRFVLDTGTVRTVVSDKVVDRLGLAAVAKTLTVTAAGEEWRRVVRLDWIAVGDTRSTNALLASVTPSATLRQLAPDIEGIIGQDFLFGLNYTLDYASKRLRWSAPSSRHGATARLSLVAREGRYLVELPPGRDGRSALLVPDSGANTLVLFEREGRTVVPAEPASLTLAVQTLSGTKAVRSSVVRDLRLGGLTLRNQLAAVIPREPDDRMAPDGLLPLHLFASVTFDARERWLILRR